MNTENMGDGSIDMDELKVNLHHAKMINVPEFREGFYAPQGSENPYTFPLKTDLARMKIATKEGDLTGREVKTLTLLNNKFYGTKWSKWSQGYWSRHWLFKVLLKLGTDI